MDPNLADASLKIEDALNSLKRELSSIRAGRANPTLIENIPVNVYGGQMKLMEVGTIAAPAPSLLTVSVWDVSIITDIQKALLEANLGLNPSIDGQLIRLPIPPLTQERREEFVKLSHQKGENAKIEIRHVRAIMRGDWVKLKESAQIGEDEFFRREKLLQDLVDKQISQVDELVRVKEEELTTL